MSSECNNGRYPLVACGGESTLKWTTSSVLLMSFYKIRSKIGILVVAEKISIIKYNTRYKSRVDAFFIFLNVDNVVSFRKTRDLLDHVSIGLFYQ